MEEILNLSIKIAKKAGKLILKNFDKDFLIKSKKDSNDLVTEIDVQSENLIIKEIKKHFPSHAILAEESHYRNKTNISDLSKAPYIWIIDPIDGTTNFTKGIPEVAVSIGIFKNNKSQKSKNYEYLEGELIAGTIFIPKFNEIFYASKGKGAFLNGKKIKVSSEKSLANSILATGFVGGGKKTNIPYFLKMLENCRDLRRLGSAATDLAFVACGRLDGFWEFGLSPWDIAAGAIIVKEAGGKVTDTNGNLLDLFGKDILATNKNIHKECIEILS